MVFRIKFKLFPLVWFSNGVGNELVMHVFVEICTFMLVAYSAIQPIAATCCCCCSHSVTRLQLLPTFFIDTEILMHCIQLELILQMCANRFMSYVYISSIYQSAYFMSSTAPTAATVT